MADSVPAALRERATTRAVLVWAVFVALLYWTIGPSPAQLVTSLATGGIVGLADLLTDAYDLRAEVESLALGTVTVGGGAALLAFGDESVTVGGSLLVVGGWIAFDAGQVLRHEGLYADAAEPRDGRAVFQEYVTRRVDETLRDRSLTRRELHEALEADDAAVDDALATLDDRGLFVREGSELRVPTDDADPEGRLERVRTKLRGGVRRLARPVTLELRTGRT